MIELVLTIEEEFDIYISDTIIEKMLTPRDYVDYIIEERTKQIEAGYTSQKGFYKLRKIFIKELGLQRKNIRPSTKLNILLNPNLKQSWKKLNLLFTGHLLPLQLSTIQKISVFSINFFISIFLLVNYTWDMALFFFFLNYPIIYFITLKLFANTLPKNQDQVSSLIRFLGYSKKLNTYNNYMSVSEKVLEICIEQFGVSANEITLDSHFIEDLKVC